MSLLPEGAGAFYFDDPVRPVRLAVHFYSPGHDPKDAPVVIAMHGVDRNATDVRDAMARSCAAQGQLLLVPEFDRIQFPELISYNFGGAGPGVPRSAWTFPIVDRLFAHVRGALDSRRERFGLFGNSAGAQFVLRYMALMAAESVEAAVATNCGAYMLPNLALDYPDGLGGLGLEQADLRRYFGRQLSLLIGAMDNDPDAHDLPRWERAMAQGPHRLARAHWYAAHCEHVARQMGAPFNWMLETVSEAGHVSQQIYDRAAEILKQASDHTRLA